MAKYERLIIYPLLFLALFLAVTGVAPIQSNPKVIEQIRAREVVIVSDYGNAVLRLGSTNLGGTFNLYNNFGNPVVSMEILDTGTGSPTAADSRITQLAVQQPWPYAADQRHFGVFLTAEGNYDDQYYEYALKLGMRWRDMTFQGAGLRYVYEDLAELELDPRAPLGDSRHDPALVLTADAERSSLSLGSYQRDRERQEYISHVALTSHGAWGGSLRLNNGSGDNRALLSSTPDGHGALWLYDRYGEESTSYTFQP